MPTFTGATRAKKVNLGDDQRRAIPTGVVSDLSFIYPDAVMASSQALDWQNLRAIEVQHTIPEWTLPPLENHCIMIQLGPAVDVSARIGEDNFTQNLKTGEVIIIPLTPGHSTTSTIERLRGH